MAQTGVMNFSQSFAVAQQMKTFEGNYANAISIHIPQIATGLKPEIPVQTYDFPYSKTNDYTGYNPSIVTRIPSLPKLVGFELTPHEFNIQTSLHLQDKFEGMSQQQIFANAMQTGSNVSVEKIKKAGAENYLNFIIEGLTKQTITRNESYLYDLITDTAQYTPSNTTSIATAIPSWTTKEGGELAYALSQGATYLNKLTGGNLISSRANESPSVTSDFELLIVVPRHIYDLLNLVWGDAFSGRNTQMGFDGNGNVNGAYRSMTLGLLAHMSGYYGAKVICAETYFNDSVINELDTLSDNFKSFWDTENAIYMFTTSNNILKPASIVRPTFRPDTMFNTMILDTNYVKTTGTYDFVSPLQYNFYKIELTTA